MSRFRCGFYPSFHLPSPPLPSPPLPSPPLLRSEIYPFVVVVMGLENTLIIVKAVMSTPVEVEVKQRIAMGMSKEGWAISRNLATLVFMLSMGIIFFNYTMKVCVCVCVCVCVQSIMTRIYPLPYF